MDDDDDDLWALPQRVQTDNVSVRVCMCVHECVRVSCVKSYGEV